jgi:hypothetical protein
MSTATARRPGWKHAPQAEQTLRERIQAKRESYPGLNEARLTVANLRSEEQSLLAKLQMPVPADDPFLHDGTREKLAALRQKIGPAQQAERTAELEASKSALELFSPEHREASEAFQGSLRSLVESFDRMMELRTVATNYRLPLTRETPFFGLDQMQAIRGQLLQIQNQWQR